MIATEAVFYADILGFAELRPTHAVTTLSDLALALGRLPGKPAGRSWKARYALGDCVFMTDLDPAWALAEATEVLTNLLMLTKSHEFPVLLRGAMAYGEVHHIKSVFQPDIERALNLVGPAVVDAVRLAERSGFKGPRLLVTTDCRAQLLAQAPELADWLLASVPGADVHEVLWLLPLRPDDFQKEEEVVRDLCALAMDLLGKHGGAPAYGVHYREFLRLTVRCLARAQAFTLAGRLVLGHPLADFVPRSKLTEAIEHARPPDDFVTQVQAAIAQLA